MKRLAFTLTLIALAGALPAAAVTPSIPQAGLPSAVDYGAALLPDRAGIVSWRTLAQVTPVKQGNAMVPEFSKDIQTLDHQQVKVQGFIIPLEMGDRQKRFLLSAVPPHCPFCMPAGPDAIVEVVAKTPVKYSIEPIVVSGTFALVKDDASGLLYRLTDAEFSGESIPAAPMRFR